MLLCCCSSINDSCCVWLKFFIFSQSSHSSSSFFLCSSNQKNDFHFYILIFAFVMIVDILRVFNWNGLFYHSTFFSPVWLQRSMKKIKIYKNISRIQTQNIFRRKEMKFIWINMFFVGSWKKEKIYRLIHPDCCFAFFSARFGDSALNFHNSEFLSIKGYTPIFF